MPSHEIRILGDPVLRTPADPVREFGDALRKLVDQMFEHMYAAEGVGLAAPQIGVGQRVFVYDIEGHSGHVINSELTVDDPADNVEDEGCLSVPGYFYPTPRAQTVTVRGYDVDGNTLVISGHGNVARCLQHENDHLDGRLYLDRLPAQLRRQAFVEIDL